MKSAVWLVSSLWLFTGCAPQTSIEEHLRFCRYGLEEGVPFTDIYQAAVAAGGFACSTGEPHRPVLFLEASNCQSVGLGVPTETAEPVTYDAAMAELSMCSAVAAPARDEPAHVTLLSPRAGEVAADVSSRLNHDITNVIVRSGIPVRYYVVQNSISCFESESGWDVLAGLQELGVELPANAIVHSGVGTCSSLARDELGMELSVRLNEERDGGLRAH